MIRDMNHHHMTTTEAAEYLRLAEHTMANWRHYGTGPRFLRAGGRVLYRRSDIDAWLESSVRG